MSEARLQALEMEMETLRERKRNNAAQEGDRERYQAAQRELISLQRVKEWDELAAYIDIPLRLRGASFDQGDECPALRRTQQYVLDDLSQGACLVLMGPTGVGKTYAAVAAIREHLMQTGTWADFWYFPSLCADLLNPKERDEAMKDLKSKDLLVLDDFGGEYLKPGGLLDSLIDEAIWHREGHILPTILTTNLLPDQMKERLSDRIVDRLRGDWGRLFVCVGESFRKQP